MRTSLLFSLLALPACTTGGGSTAHVAGETDADTDTDADYLEVAALGFEYVGGWDQEAQLLENYVYIDSAGDPQPGGPYVWVTLASLDYFSMSSDTPGFEDEYCEFLAYFYHEPAEFSGMEFDWDAGKGGTGEELETWGAFEGYLEIDLTSFSYRCEELDPDQFEDGDPIATLDGMHFGLGFGPLTDHLFETLKDGEDFDEYQDAYMTQYVAMNHPDGSGGFTFDAYDWNGALLVDTDYDSCVDVDDGSGGTFEVCGEYQVTDDNYYVPGDTNIAPRRSYMVGFSAWLEDTPNLDLSILKDGTAGM